MLREAPITTPQNWTTATPKEWAALFQDGLAAFKGRAFPRGPGGDKVARLLLSYATGCDAVITSESFRVQHQPHYQHSDYFPGTIPVLITQLLAWSGASLPTSEVRVLLDPEAASERRPDWLAGRRLLWLRADAVQILIAVRDGADSNADALREWPEPLPGYVPGRRVFTDLPEPLTCPHCGVAAQRYRQFDSGTLGCLTCNRSFSPL